MNDIDSRKNGWLVLTRAIGQGISIVDTETGEKILEISINDIKCDVVTRFGFKADKRYAVLRNEITDRQRG